MQPSSRSHDSLAADYDRYGDFEWLSADVAQVAAGLLAPRLGRDAVAMDLGCGTGRYSSAMVARGLRVLSVDLSAAMLERVEGTWGRVRADAHRLPLTDGSVDAALVTLLFQHLSDPLLACGEIIRVLKPGGFLATWSYTGNTPEGVGREPIHERLESIYREEWVQVGATPKVRGWGGKRAESELMRLFPRREIIDDPALTVDTRNTAGWLREKFDHRFRDYFDYPAGKFERFRERVGARLDCELPEGWQRTIERGQWRYRLALFRAEPSGVDTGHGASLA